MKKVGCKLFRCELFPKTSFLLELPNSKPKSLSVALFPRPLMAVVRNIPPFQLYPPCLSPESLIVSMHKMASYVAQDGILCYTRWHLMLHKMASCADKGIVFQMKGKEVTVYKQGSFCWQSTKVRTVQVPSAQYAR